MSSDPVLQTRTRRSRTVTPLIPNGTPRILDTPKQSKSEHDSSYLHPVYPEGFEGTPVIGGRHVDASFRNEDKVSPMLAKLRMTPGRLLKDKQSLLVRKHESARQRVDSMNVGGGVSLWPEMESMRLTDEEVIHLAGVCVALIAFVIALFYYLHGGSVLLLLEFERNLTDFMKNHNIVTSLGQGSFDETTITWHNDYRIILDTIHRSFDTTKVPMSYMMYILVYSVTICVLFYYLVDNMFAKSKLSPRRIKRWACLLSVSSTWTLLMVLNLTCAYRTELAVEKNVHLLSEVLIMTLYTAYKNEPCSPTTGRETWLLFSAWDMSWSYRNPCFSSRSTLSCLKKLCLLKSENDNEMSQSQDCRSNKGNARKKHRTF